MSTSVETCVRFLEREDFLRRSSVRLGGRGLHKEWQHFIVAAEGLTLLVNFSLLDEPSAFGRAEVGRLTVLARSENWHGDVERFGPDDVEAHAGELAIRMGASTVRFESGAYRLNVRQGVLHAELELVPAAAPVVLTHQRFSSDATMSWLCAPRLCASGRVVIGQTVHVLRGAAAYHDHNWAQFAWGDDFAWEWGTALPSDPACPFSAVYTRMTDRFRAMTRSQSISLWRGTERCRVFRDAEIEVQWDGRHRQPKPLKLPRALALLAPGPTAEVPACLSVRAGHGADAIHLSFRPRDLAQLLVPSEREVDRLITLNEAFGSVTLSGGVDGEPVSMEGHGAFEFTSG